MSKKFPKKIFKFYSNVTIKKISFKSPNLGMMECKIYVLHHPIRGYNISYLLKIQYILPYIRTSQ